MAHAKQAAKRRRMTSLPVMGAAGMSLSLAGGASAASTEPVADHQPFNALTNPQITLGEEEISDVSLLTFYVFDKENLAKRELGVQFAQWGRCGCRGCRCGCRCGCGWRGCVGCGCGWGCCASWGRCRWC